MKIYINVMKKLQIKKFLEIGNYSNLQKVNIINANKLYHHMDNIKVKKKIKIFYKKN